MEEKRTPETCTGDCASCSGCSSNRDKPSGKSLVIFSILVVVCIAAIIIASKIIR